MVSAQPSATNSASWTNPPRRTQVSTSGGSSETDDTAVTVMPQSRPTGSFIVSTPTPPARRAMASRKSSTGADGGRSSTTGRGSDHGVGAGRALIVSLSVAGRGLIPARNPAAGGSAVRGRGEQRLASLVDGGQQGTRQDRGVVYGGRHQGRPHLGDPAHGARHQVAQRAIAGGADLTGQHDKRGVDDCADGGETGRKPVGQLVEEGLRRGARGQRRPYRLGGAVRDDSVLRGQRGHRLGAHQALECPLVRLSAARRQRHAGHREVTDLAGRARGATVQATAKHDGQADAAAHPQQDHVVDVAGRAVRALGDRRQVHVVLDRHGAAELLAKTVAEPAVPARQVEHVSHVAGCGIDHARRPEDDVGHVGHRDARLAGHRADGVAHHSDRIVGLGGGAGHPAADLTGHVGDGGDHGVRRHVDAHAVRTSGTDGIELGARPPACRAGADDLDQAAFLQAGHQLARGDLRQAGELTQTRSGQRAVGQQQFQCIAVVDRAEQARDPRLTRHAARPRIGNKLTCRLAGAGGGAGIRPVDLAPPPAPTRGRVAGWHRRWGDATRPSADGYDIATVDRANRTAQLGERTDGGGLDPRHLVAHVAENLGHGQAERLADGGQQFGGRFLAASFDFGEISQTYPGRRRHLSQGAALVDPTAAQDVADQASDEDHRPLPSRDGCRHVHVHRTSGHRRPPEGVNLSGQRVGGGQDSPGPAPRSPTARRSRSSARTTASRRTVARVLARSGNGLRDSTRTPSAHVTATWKVPAGWPSCESGPATPVVATPYLAPHRRRTPSAIAIAVVVATAPSRSSRSAGTPARSALSSVAYATTPPRNTADTPGTEINAPASSPPVNDSAAATVAPAATNDPTTACSRFCPSAATVSPRSSRARRMLRSAAARASAPSARIRTSTSPGRGRNASRTSSAVVDSMGASRSATSRSPRPTTSSDPTTRGGRSPAPTSRSGITCSSTMADISAGTPGTAYTVPCARSSRTPSSEPQPLGSGRIGRPSASRANAGRVWSSLVLPSPPVTTTAGASAKARSTARTTASAWSGTNADETTPRPASASRRPRHGPFVSFTWPARSSSPTSTSATTPRPRGVMCQPGARAWRPCVRCPAATGRPARRSPDR